MSLDRGSMDKAVQQLKVKILTIEDRLQTTNCCLKEVAVNQIGVMDNNASAYRDFVARNTLFDTVSYRGAGYLLRLQDVKVFTTSPALADMEIGEIALGDGTGGTGQDEWFFKPDASKIVALDSEGNARTITT